jgi:hypothetical protein
MREECDKSGKDYWLLLYKYGELGWDEKVLNFASGNVTYLFRNVHNGPLQ